MFYHIKKNDIGDAAKVLGKSFIDYPIFTYVIPNRVIREKKLKYVFVFLLNFGMLKGEVIAPSNNLEGISIWINSASPKPDILKIIFQCIIPLVSKVNPISVVRLIKIGITKEKIRNKILKDSYYLLDIIGINPVYQRKGFAKKMIEEKLKEFGDSSCACYLETSDKNNIAFYENFGFKLIHQYELQKVMVFCLLRK